MFLYTYTNYESARAFCTSKECLKIFTILPKIQHQNVNGKYNSLHSAIDALFEQAWLALEISFVS